MLSDDEIKTLVMRKFDDADSSMALIKNDRQKAQNYYNCMPYGDEKEGFSTFVSSDVRDTIEWTLPQIVEMFVGDDVPVEFSAKAPEDVEQAAIETDYVRHVFGQQNNGFLIAYTWIKDGLLYKNGIVKSWWDERVDEVNEEYEGKDLNAFLALQADPQIEIKEVSAYLGDDDENEMSLEEALALPPEQLMQVKFEINAVRREDNSQVRIQPIPPENFFIESGYNSLDISKASFVCHRDAVYKSDLIVDGYDRALVDTIPTGDEGFVDTEKVTRFKDENRINFDDTDSEKITIYECYVRHDFDGDGKAELRMIKLAGPGGEVMLENEVVDRIPFDCWTPVINTHKFYGKSVAELVTDLQLLRSVLMRQMLNNLYLTNNPRKLIVDNMVNKSDLLSGAPGAIIRAKSLDAIRDEVVPFVAEKTLPILGLVEEMRSERTGVSPNAQALDIKALADSTNIVGPMLMSQAMQRIKMIARIFAETGFKGLMRSIHELCSKHDTSRTFPRANGFAQVNPREWTRRTSLNVKVGVGVIDKMQRVQAINQVIANHTQIAAQGGLGGPLLDPANVYTALVEQAKLLGYVDGAKFYKDPATFQPPPQEQDVASEALQIEEARTIADIQKQAANNQLELKKHNDEMALRQKELDAKLALEQAKLAQERELAREEMLLKYGASVAR